jgi:hypothetical protein
LTRHEYRHGAGGQRQGRKPVWTIGRSRRPGRPAAPQTRALLSAALDFMHDRAIEEAARSEHVKRRSATRVVSCVLAGSISSACATQGRYLEPEKAEQAQQTVKNAQELEAALGIPSRTIPRDDGRVMWVSEGIHKSVGVTSCIPYVGLLAGYNDKTCTRRIFARSSAP